MLAVASPKTNGSSVAIWERNAAPTTRRRGASAGMWRDQSPRKAPNDTGLESTISAAPMNDGQNRDWAPGPPAAWAPAYEGSKSPPKATAPRRKSTVAAVTAILLMKSMNRNP